MTDRDPRRTALRAICGVGVAVLALAGCSGSDEPSNDSASTSAGSGSTDDAGGGESAGTFDKEAAKEFLLTAQELGDGWSAVPEAQIEQALAQTAGPLTQALDTMQIEPAECQDVMQTMIGQMGDLAEKIDQTAIALFTSGADYAAQALAPASVLAAQDLGTQVEACPEMTLTVQGVTATASLTPVEIDLGDSSAGVVASITLNTGGQEVNQSSALAVVVQGKAALSISLSGADATETTLADITEKAFVKAESVLS